MQLEVASGGAGVAFHAVMSIAFSQISVLVTTKGEEDDVPTLRNMVENVVRMHVDAMGYLWGRGYDVEITSLTYQGGKHVVFGVGVDVLDQMKREVRPTLADLFALFSTDTRLAQIFADLRESIRAGTDTAFHCYRAIEDIRQTFVKAETEDRSVSWQRLREALRVDRSWIDPIESIAVKQRHGVPVFQTGPEREDAWKRTWRLVDRYVSYLTEHHPLTDEFEILR